MKTYFDCIPCFLRQALEAARFATSDTVVHEQVLRGVLKAAGKMDLSQSPPVMGQTIHRIVRKLSHNPDPYRHIKDSSNRYALTLYSTMAEKIKNSPNPFETAIRLAIAGNIIDFGVNGTVDLKNIGAIIRQSLSAPVLGNRNSLFEAISSAKQILYIGDNAGEIVFDRLLIEQMPTDKIVFAVRGNPIINDATVEDAAQAGLMDVVSVINNGSDAPGTILEDCSDAFREVFDSADLVIAKGQGNFETLSDEDKMIYFLLKVKCQVIAGHIGCDPGTMFIGRTDRDRSTMFNKTGDQGISALFVKTYN